MKSLLIVLLFGLTTQAQEWSFSATASTQEACAQKVVQNLIGDARYTDLNNLSLKDNTGILLTGMNKLGSYTVISQDKNGWEYKISAFIDFQSATDSINCSVGPSYPVTIFRYVNGGNQEKVFGLRCVQQGKDQRCTE